MKPKKWPITVLFIAFATANLVDIITALSGNSAYEANPIFLFSGSWLVAIIPKLIAIAVFGFFWHKERYSSKTAYFAILAALVYGTLIISLGAASNVYAMHQVHQSQITGQPLPTVDDTTAKNFYWIFVMIFYVVPFCLSFITFLIYNSTVERIEVIKRKSRKGLSWTKRLEMDWLDFKKLFS